MNEFCNVCFMMSEAPRELYKFATDFNIVLMRSPNVFRIFTVHSSRFLAEIHDFDEFS